MSDHGLLPQGGRPRHHDLTLRLALVAGLVAMAVGLLTAGPGGRPFETRWRLRRANARPFNGDMIYRTGLALRAVQRFSHRYPDIDPEPFIQAGMGNYERLALPRKNPNLHAMYRLAVIYSKQGHPDEGLKLLERLVQLDEERGTLYFAVSSVYDTKPVEAAGLRQAARTIEREGGWLARLILPDCYRRLGDQQQARQAEVQAAQTQRTFALFVLVVAAVYGVLFLVGAMIIIRSLWTALFLLPTQRPTLWRRPIWSPLDAVEVGAVLLCTTALLAVVSGSLTRGWDLTSKAPWAQALVILLAYLISCTAALLLMRRRMRRWGGGLLRTLGAGNMPGPSAIAYGIAGYGVIVALFVMVAIALRETGLDQLLPTAQLLHDPQSVPAIAVYFALACVVAPVVEELIFRGFVYPAFRERSGVPAATVLSAAFFGVAHIGLDFSGIVAVTCIGVLLACLYERTGTLWPSITAHALHNFLVLAIVVGSGL